MDFHQNIFIPKHCSRTLVFSGCVTLFIGWGFHLQSVPHYPTNPRSLFTLFVATGCKQVCPPAVKLQKTMNASEVQPRFGSIQNQPERIRRSDKVKTYIPNLHMMRRSKLPTIIEFMTTVQQILTDTSWVLPRSQGLFDPFDDGA